MNKVDQEIFRYCPNILKDEFVSQEEIQRVRESFEKLITGYVQHPEEIDIVDPNKSKMLGERLSAVFGIIPGRITKITQNVDQNTGSFGFRLRASENGHAGFLLSIGQSPLDLRLKATTNGSVISFGNVKPSSTSRDCLKLVSTLIAFSTKNPIQ